MIIQKFKKLRSGEVVTKVPVKAYKSGRFKRIDVKVKVPTKRDVWVVSDYKIKGIRDGFIPMYENYDNKKGTLELTFIQIVPTKRLRKGLIKEEKEIKKQVKKFKKALGL